MTDKKVAVLTGGQGNLGPIWKSELESMGYKVFVIDLPHCNVADMMDVKRAKIFCLNKIGVPSVIVNNAACDSKPSDGGGKFWDYERPIDVNLKGAMNICKAFIPEMNGGVIINIGSIMGNSGADWRNYPEGFDKAVGYNVSKAGLVQFSRSICTQFGRDGIRSVTISFGPYDSRLPEEFKKKFLHNVPLGRTISEQSFRSSLRYAIECPELTGQQIIIDGGLLAW